MSRNSVKMSLSVVVVLLALGVRVDAEGALSSQSNYPKLAGDDLLSQFSERTPRPRYIQETRGEYIGLGGYVKVIYPDSVIGVWSLLHANTPMGLAGIHSGDLILAIDDSTTKGMTASTAVKLLEGGSDLQVVLRVQRTGIKDPFELKVERAAVPKPSVRFKTLFEDQIGYIKLDNLLEGSSAQCRDAVMSLKAQGMEQLILDLRANELGVLAEAVAVADLFFPEQRRVISSVDGALSDTTHYYTQGPSLIGEHALTVLVDNRTAGIAEIVAGTIQDWDRGLVLGVPTVGKGSVQEVITIGGKAELTLTTAVYILPSGRPLDKRLRRDLSPVQSEDKIYKTRLFERSIYDNGGIDPDILVDAHQITPLFEQLAWGDDYTFFYFAAAYGLQKSDINKEFRADANTLAVFRQFLESRDFEYISPIELRYQNIEETVEEKEMKKLDKSLKKIKEGINRIEEMDWSANATLLIEKLTYDILEKNISLTTALGYEVSVNPYVQRAQEVLNDQQAYGEWLGKDHMSKKIKEED